MIRIAMKSLLAFAVSTTAPAQSLTAPQVLRVDAGRADQGYAVTTDRDGNIYVAGQVEDGSRPTRFAVIKYDNRGNTLWRSHASAAFGGPEGDARAVAVDQSGNVYATGRVFLTSGFQPIVNGVLVRFGPNGVQQWSRALGTAGIGVRVAVDGQGDIVVASNSGVVARYDPAGTVLWQRRYEGAATTDTMVITDMRLDTAGNTTVTGYAFNATGLQGATDVVTIRYNVAGARLWQHVYSETAESDEKVWSLAIAADGSALVNGVTAAGTAGELEVFPLVLRYDANGTLVFVRNSPELGGRAVAAAAGGDILVAGDTNITRLDSQGQTRWTVSTQQQLGVQSIVVGLAGEIYASGALATWLLSADGVVQARSVFNDPGRQRLTTNGLRVDAAGNVLVVGTSASALSTSADMITLRYGAAGSPPPPPVATLPAAPSNVVASVVGTTVVLTWRDNSGNERGFSIERCAGNNCIAFAAVGETQANVTRFVDSQLGRNKRLSYRVRAFNEAGRSAASTVVSVRLP